MKNASISLLALLAGATLPGMAAAQTLDPIVRIASGTVFPNCTADHGGNQSGTNFPGSVVEPWLTVDPTLTGHLLSGVQQDRWSSGGSRGLRAGVSTDGGHTWVTSVPAHISECTGGKFQRSTDPWTGIGQDGTAYFFSLGFDNNPSASVNSESAMLVSRSLDGGRSWGTPVTLIDDTDPKAFNDKNSLTVDPKIAGNAYAVWDRLYGAADAFRAPGGSDEHGTGNAAIIAQDGLQMTRNRIRTLRAAAAGTADAATQEAAAQVTHGPTYYSRTTDSGVTWSKAVPIYDPGPYAQTIGNVIVALPNGDLLDFFNHIHANGTLSIDYVRSTDHGLTWSKTPVTATRIGGEGAVTPDTQSPIRSEDIVFSVTSDLVTGNLYVMWQDRPAASGSQLSVLFTQSTNGGATWSAATRVNKTPANAAVPLRGQGFNGTIAASPGGTLIATYYDFRNDTSTAGQELADVWVVFCTPSATAGDCTKPANWGREARLTTKSFNFAQAPLTDAGLFLGDYFAIGVQADNAWPAFTAVTGAGQTTLYTRRIHLPAPATN